MTSLLFEISSALLAPTVGAVVSAFIGRHVARRVTENELKKSEERALKAEALYNIAIAYLHQVAAWATRNGIADRLPDPPQELGLNI